MRHPGTAEDARVQQFRAVALPHLGEAHALAVALLGDRAAAAAAVEECYLRALRSFDHRPDAEIKPWLLAILRNLCYASFHRGDPRRGDEEAPTAGEGAAVTPARALIDALPLPLREAVALREFNALSYREITEVSGVPIGVVMFRLARARALLAAGLKASADGGAAPPPIVYSISADGATITGHRLGNAL